eukprot:scaffold4490_cov130-Isochrysis_galbana.AAC.2
MSVWAARWGRASRRPSPRLWHAGVRPRGSGARGEEWKGECGQGEGPGTGGRQHAGGGPWRPYAPGRGARCPGAAGACNGSPGRSARPRSQPPTVEALRWERHELLQVGGQVLLRNLIVLGTLAPDVGRDCLLRVEVGPRQVFLRAKHHALALLLVGLVDGALVEPILKLLRANLVHAAGLAVVLGDLGDHLLGQAGRPAKVVLAGRRLAGVRRGLHPAPADVGAAIGDGRLAEPAADDRGRIVLIREVGVPITHDTATRVAAIELTVAAALEECLHRCVGLVNGAARKCALLALLHVFVPRARRAHRDLQRHNNRADAGKQRRGAAQCKREREGGCHACGGRARAQSALLLFIKRDQITKSGPK